MSDSKQFEELSFAHLFAVPKKNFIERKLYFFEKNLFAIFLLKLGFQLLVFHFLPTSKTCFSNLFLNNLITYP